MESCLTLSSGTLRIFGDSASGSVLSLGVNGQPLRYGINTTLAAQYNTLHPQRHIGLPAPAGDGVLRLAHLALRQRRSVEFQHHSGLRVCGKQESGGYELDGVVFEKGHGCAVTETMSTPSRRLLAQVPHFAEAGSAFMRVSGQRASQRPIDGLVKLQNDAPAAYTADPALSKKAASDADLAALTLVASTILFPSPHKTPPRGGHLPHQ